MAAGSRRGEKWVPLAAAALSLAIHVPLASRPFAFDLEGSVGAFYSGPIQKFYDRVGFWRLHGAPVREVLPTEPPTVTGLYPNHPPLRDWLSRIVCATFGLSEASIRALPIACTALTAAWLALLAFRAGGMFGAFAAILLGSALPAVFLYGHMPNYEQPLLAMGVSAGLFLPVSDQPRRRLAACAGLVFLATMTDAVGALLPAAFFLQEWTATRRRPKLFPFAIVAAAAAAAIAAWLLLVVWWSGGASAASAALGAAFDSTQRALAAGSSSWPRHVLELFGIPGTVLMLLGVAWAASWGRRSDPAASGFILGWSLFALGQVLLFPAHARLHDYWVYYFLPVAVVGGATVLGRVAATGTVGLLAAVAGLGTVVASSAALDYEREKMWDRTAMVDAAAAVNVLGGQETLVYLFTNDSVTTRSYYLHPWIMAGTTPMTELERGVQAFLEGRFTCRRIALVGTRFPFLRFQVVPPELEARLLAAGFTKRTLSGDVRDPTVPRGGFVLEAFVLDR